MAGPGDEITIGELGRRLERFSADMQGAINRMVAKEVYDRDMQDVERRLEGHDLSISALANNRRQIAFGALAVGGAVLSATVGAAISYGLHP